MITLDYRGSQNYTGSKRYPGTRRWIPWHNSYHRFVCAADQSKVFQAFSLRCALPTQSRPKMPEHPTSHLSSWLCVTNFEGKTWNWSSSFFSKNKLKNTSVDVMLDIAFCYWGSRDTVERVKIKKCQLIKKVTHKSFFQKEVDFLARGLVARPICLPNPVTFFIFT